ncbi:MAG: grasp-with-spasm system SPASM domain peptide maturase [Bacteroidia bacterium]|nr:grasp-with-spasm system SPASM domain peptide maturase [Bacteroidia bacterium]
MTNQNYFKLFACCIPVQGAKRTILCDLQRQAFHQIPTELVDLLSDNAISLPSLNNQVDGDELGKLLDILVEKEFGFYTSTPELFPSIDLSLDDNPNIIDNAIIDIDEDSDFELGKVMEQLSELLCAAVELRVYCQLSLKKLTKLLTTFENTTIRTIHLTLPSNDEFEDSAHLAELFFGNKKIRQVNVYGSKRNQLISMYTGASLVYCSAEVIDETSCGNISPAYFSANLDMFKQSQRYNNCLYKKMSIDRFGQVKNCPSMSKSFGHVHEVKLLDVVQNQEFTKPWSINKDKIAVCQDCEFRYICLDCRAYTDNDEALGKPAKCKYNPYTAVWDE